MAELDFVVFGIPRSGTHAFAQAFNLHPEIFCGIEFLKLRHRVTNLPLPHVFIRPRKNEKRLHQRHRDLLNAKLQQGPVRFYANKMPAYYFRLRGLLDEKPALKMFYIYRSPTSFVHSWDSRAARPNDKWPSGRRGAFGVIELVFCLKRLASLATPVSAVSYDAMFFDDPALMARMVEQVGADARRFDQQAFETELFGQASRKTIRSGAYEELFKRFRFDAVDAYFAANPFSMTDADQFRTLVREQFRSVPQPHEFVDWLRRFDPAALGYLERWREIVRKRLDNTTDEPCRWIDDYAEQACLAAR
jgi:hypothetical protein